MVARKKSGDRQFFFIFGLLLLVLVAVVSQINSLVPASRPILLWVSLVLLTAVSVVGFYVGAGLGRADHVKVLASVFVLAFLLPIFASSILTTSSLFLAELLSVEVAKYVQIPFVLVADFLRHSMFFVIPIGIVPAFNKLNELAR